MRPKICAYVQEAYSKQNYNKECMDTRQFVGLRVIIDVLERAGYTVDYAGSATVHNYDYVLVSLTSDCDWWTYISERQRWRKGNYKVIVGGAGVLHITPFLPFADIVIWGRGEDVITDIIAGVNIPDSAVETKHFSPDNLYYIAQAKTAYPHAIRLTDKRDFREGAIGCNHKCLYCGYTWQRRFLSANSYYAMSDSLFGGIEDKERALLDMSKDYSRINFAKLRTTAIDGLSERLRLMVKKNITNALLTEFFSAMCDAVRYRGVKPHQIKLYNIVGYPTETDEDMREFTRVLAEADGLGTQLSKQWSLVLHSTPFRAMPATPMACEPMAYREYRGEIAKTLRDRLYKGNIFYQGRNFWAVESMGTDSLPTVILSAIAHRGDERDTEAITRLCATPKFWSANGATRRATLEKYFDIDKLFGAYTAQTLPSRYLRTYAKIENWWTKG